MKRQYLGDSKDSFKWDYHNFLLQALGYNKLQIAWMMTPDDHGKHGRTAAILFPARQEIISLCADLRSSRDPDLLYHMPTDCGASYEVSFHESQASSVSDDGSNFFSGLEVSTRQVIFLDPDNGFEPERSSSNHHVRYVALDALMKRIPANNVITVFQHHRRKKFPHDFSRIRERLLSGYSTAIYWQALMFVCLSTNAKTINRVNKINADYAKCRPVQILT